MTWIQRDADYHKCVLPEHIKNDGVTTGDIWECDFPPCKAKWQVTMESDQREPGYWFTWKRV